MNKTRILLIALVAFLVFPAMAMSLDVSKAHKYVIQYFWSAKGADAGHIPAYETNVNSFLEHTAYSSAGDDNYDSGYLFYRLQQKYEEGGSYVGAPRESYYLDAWSFSNIIDKRCGGWAGQELFYSRADKDPGTAGSGLLNNANIRKWNIGTGVTAHERFGVKQIPATGDSLRVKYDTRTIYPTLMETNLTGYDFMDADPGKAEGAYDTRLYVSGAKKANFDANGTMIKIAHSGYNQDVGNGPWNSWGDKFNGPAGSGYNMLGRSAVGHEADVLSYEISGFDGYSYSYTNATIFEHAWKTAAMMLRDLKGYNPGGDMDALLAGTLTWDTSTGHVVGSTNDLSYYDNFMRYVFDISALIVQDVNFDGELNGDDSFIFAVFDDGRFNQSQDWGGNPNFPVATLFDGSYFQGNVVFRCDGSTVSVIGAIDPSDTEQIDALDLAGEPIPEPGTIMMIIGGALALAGGIIRKRLH
jgi:hypothetical protein